MKHCPNCNVEAEADFEVCWNCGYSFTEKKVVEFTEIENKKKEDGRNLNCLRCVNKMQFAGNYRFHEGFDPGFFGNFFELFTNKESFDLYICPGCGKVEFFSPIHKI